jgi:transposase
MPRPRKYDDELKQRAVRLTLESGRPIAHVAADLGIGAESLRAWVRQAEADAAGGTPSMLTTAERERLRRSFGKRVMAP